MMCAVSDINQRSPLCSLPAHDLLTSTGLSRTGMGPPGERSSSPIKWGVLVEASCRKAHGRRRRVFANYPVASPMQVQPGGLFPGGAGRRRPRPTAPGEQVPEGLNTDREAMLTLSLCSRRRFNKWQNCASRIPIPRFVWVRDERRLHKAGRPLKTADPELPLPPPRRLAPWQNDDFQALGSNRTLWHPYHPPGSGQGAVVNQKDFLGTFWPWFKAATLLLKVRQHHKLVVEGRKMCWRRRCVRSAFGYFGRAMYDSVNRHARRLGEVRALW